MARYFFDIHDGAEIHDDIGREVENRHMLRQEALTVITGLAAAEGEDCDGYTIVLKVRNEAGSTALTLRMVVQVDDPETRRLELVS